MATKTNIGLVEYAQAQLGNPYWFGTYGQTADEALYKGKKKQYPLYYTAKDFPSQYGKRVHDCSGLIKGYLMSESPTSAPKYDSKYDTNANGMRKACKEQGDISTIPEIPGVLVFYSGHVGVYIGDGYVIEARGHAYGVVKTKLSDRSWKWWGKHPYIVYSEEQQKKADEGVKMVNVSVVQLKNGSKGEAVKTLQRLLKVLNYKDKDGKSLTVDGDFGAKTEYAVESYQKRKGLTADGIVGAKTWDALING